MGRRPRRGQLTPFVLSVLTVVTAVLVGLVVGVSLGALGGGGSILTVPALVYLLGQEPKAAVTGSLVIVGITSVMALIPHWRAGRVQVIKGIVFGVLGIAGSLVGSMLSARVPSQVLLVGFAALMLLVAVLMVRRASRTSGTDHAEELPPVIRRGPLRVDWARATRIALAASAVGLLTGFFGVGGGFILVPALVLALGFPMPVAVGTSLLVIAINSVTALVSRAGHDIAVDWTLIAVFTGAAIVGSLLGGRLASRVPAAVLTRAFAVLLVVVALGVGAETVLGSIG